MNAKASVEQAEARYEAAEEAFQAGIREERGRSILSRLADDVAMHATAWSSAGYEAFS